MVLTEVLSARCGDVVGSSKALDVGRDVANVGARNAGRMELWHRWGGIDDRTAERACSSCARVRATTNALGRPRRVLRDRQRSFAQTASAREPDPADLRRRRQLRRLAAER